jgi:PAS domain S-box-containing protein
VDEAKHTRPHREGHAALGDAVIQILAESTTLTEAAPRLLARIGSSLGWEVGALWEVDPGMQALLCVDTWQTPTSSAAAFSELSRSITFAPGVGLPGRVWATEEPVLVHDVTREANFPRAQAATEAGLHAGFGFPIAAGDRVLGVIEFFSQDARAPDAGLIETIASASSQIALFMESRQAEDDLRTDAALHSSMLDSTLDCVIAMDHEGRVIEFNPAAEATFGYSREQAIGAELAELVIPPNLRERHRHGLARYLAGGEGAVLDRWVELSGMRRDGSEFPADLAVTRIRDADPPKFMAYIRDISERKRGQEALQFLVRASDALDDSLDLDSTLQTLARLTVPFLADGCIVDLRAEDGSIERAASSAADETYEPILEELRRHPIDPEGAHPIARAMRTGQMEIVPDVSDSFRRDISTTDDYYEALQRWPAKSVVVVPMKLRGRVIGTLSLASFSENRSWSSHELSVITELARRATDTLENARLFEERTRLAQTLRESLLPPRLPELTGAEVAARFRPAASSSAVSGDFYDVFEVGDFDWAITIGDVSGRGVEAAATTALARHTIRAVAIHGATPAAALTVLNDALLSQSSDLRICTAVVAVLAIGSAGARLSIASAGHPPPLHLHADGRVEPIVSSGTLLGVVDDPALAEADVNLAVGDSVVFYTDGLISIRPDDRQQGLEELVSVVESCVDLNAAVTAESIDKALLSAERGDLRDDAAILVLRILDADKAPDGGAEPASAERRQPVKMRRLSWSRLAGRGNGSDRPPSHRVSQSDPRLGDESQTGGRHDRSRSEAERS